MTNITINKGRVHVKDFATFTITPGKTVEDVSLIKDSMQNGIVIRIAATHAGKYNKNHRFYIPDKVKAGVSSWTANFGKPILVHHDEKHDAIGRAVAAKYVELAPGSFMDHKINDSKYRIADTRFWDALSSNKISFLEKVNMIKAADAIIRDSAFQGLGYIELAAHITDPDAIQKIRDGRYLTGSVGASSDHAVCNVCSQDWASEGRCDHEMGTVYDDVKAGLIFGNLDYEEWSFVNNPADVKSSVLDIKNNTEKVFVLTPVSDQTEDKEIMTVNIKDFTEEQTIALLDKAFSTTGGLTEEESELIYELMVQDMDPTVVTDAKLSSEKRKSLPSSTFCGPDKSFPVPDCAHVTAARKLIGKYKGTGSKDSILACVDRKALAFGCDSAKDATIVTIAATDDVNDTIAIQAGHASNILNCTGDALKSILDNDQGKKLIAELIATGLVLDLSVHTQFLENQAKWEAEKAQLILAKDSVIEVATKDMKDQLKALRTELKAVFDDAIALEDKVLALTVENRKLKVDKLETLYKLDSSLTDEVKNTFIKLNDDILEQSISTLSAKVDIQKIVDRLSVDTNTSTIEKVNFPAGTIETSGNVTDGPTFASQAKVDDTYRKILIGERNSVKADAYYKDAVQKGLARVRN